MKLRVPTNNGISPDMMQLLTINDYLMYPVLVPRKEALFSHLHWNLVQFKTVLVDKRFHRSSLSLAGDLRTHGGNRTSNFKTIHTLVATPYLCHYFQHEGRHDVGN